MPQKSYEIIILRPTPVFFAFLAAQLPEDLVPNPGLLKIDNTAYVVKKHNSDEETLDEIEKHFKTMFRHEICRWLGGEARNEIESSFLDFLCCFKLEMHQHIILQESSIEKGRQLILLKPKMPLLHWLKSLVDEQEDLVDVVEQVSLSHLEENATVMIKNFPNLMSIKPFVKNYYTSIFSTAMSRMTAQSRQWPIVNSFESFSHYFALEIHTQLVLLSH